MALAHCILGKFLGVVCHCFSLPLDVPTFAARCLYVYNNARDPSSKRRNCGRESIVVFIGSKIMLVLFLLLFSLIPSLYCTDLKDIV